APRSAARSSSSSKSSRRKRSMLSTRVGCSCSDIEASRKTKPTQRVCNWAGLRGRISGGSDLDDFDRQAGSDGLDGAVAHKHLLAEAGGATRVVAAATWQLTGGDAGADLGHRAGLQRRVGQQLAELLVDVMHRPAPPTSARPRGTRPALGWHAP